MFRISTTTEHDRLLTNLDPDKLYPVYGDSSTIVYDAQSQGKFYLAVDSDEFHSWSEIILYPFRYRNCEVQATL